MVHLFFLQKEALRSESFNSIAMTTLQYKIKYDISNKI